MLRQTFEIGTSKANSSFGHGQGPKGISSFPTNQNDTINADARAQEALSGCRRVDSVGVVNAQKQAGTDTVIWDGRDDSGAKLASGTYFCRLTTGGFDGQVMMVLAR